MASMDRSRRSHTSTLSQRQFPQGVPSITSHRTFRARQATQARAARRLVAFCGCSELLEGEARFLLFLPVTVLAEVDAGDCEAAEPSDASVAMMAVVVVVNWDKQGDFQCGPNVAGIGEDRKQFYLS
uniref:Uncharacterized protein n=1 Tax=Fusarium oxysporum (strain Fo5176) TaxID=660025 RepID=A0A0D2YKG3_FUSOF